MSNITSSITPLDIVNALNGVIDEAEVALKPEDVVSTYNATGTAPVNGTAVAGALDSLIELIPDVDQTYSASSTNAQSGTAVASALANIFPSQEGQSGKFLSTDGTVVTWETVSAGDTLPSQTGNEGKFLTTNGSEASWATLSAGETLPSKEGQAGKFLSTDGTVAVWETVSAGETLPSKEGQSGKFLSTDGTIAVWETVDAVSKDTLSEVQCIVETYQNGNSWYKIYSDGWCEQGGLIAGGSTSGSVNFLGSFINTNYSLTAGVYHTAATTFEFSSPTRTGFSYVKSVAVANVYWRASGYIY